MAENEKPTLQEFLKELKNRLDLVRNHYAGAIEKLQSDYGVANPGSVISQYNALQGQGIAEAAKAGKGGLGIPGGIRGVGFAEGQAYGQGKRQTANPTVFPGARYERGKGAQLPPYIDLAAKLGDRGAQSIKDVVNLGFPATIMALTNKDSFLPMELRRGIDPAIGQIVPISLGPGTTAHVAVRNADLDLATYIRGKLEGRRKKKAVGVR